MANLSYRIPMPIQPTSIFPSASESLQKYSPYALPVPATVPAAKLTSTMPAKAGAYRDLGQRLQDAGQYKEAEAAYRRAIELAPFSTAALSQLAILMKVCQRDEEAIAAYQAVLRIEPQNATAHNELGILLQAAGRLDEALVAYRELLRLIPDAHVAYNNIGSVLQIQEHFEAAMEQYRRVLEIAPTLPLPIATSVPAC